MPIASLAGRKCIITGASRGIGFAIAQRFAAEGATCTLIGRHNETLSEAVSSLPGTGHGHVAGSVSSLAFWEDLVQEMRKHDGHVHTLVNAAGITHYSLLATTRAELLEEVVQTNLMGTIWACKSLVKGMMRRKEGKSLKKGLSEDIADLGRRMHYQCGFCARSQGWKGECGICSF